MPSRPQGDKHAKGILLVLCFSLKRFSCTHSLCICYLCAFSSHVTFTHAPLCIVSCCVFVYGYSCSVDVRKRPRLHIRVLGFARRPLLVIALAFSLDSPLLVNLRFDRRPCRRMKPPFWTRGLWSDSAVRSAVWPPIWNRRSYLMHLLFSGSVLRFTRRFRNRRMKPPFSPLFSGWILRLWSAAWPPNETAELDILGRFLSRAQFCGQILRPRPQN